MAVAWKFITPATPAATLVSGGAGSVFYGISATPEAAVYYIKIYWEGTGTAPPKTPGGTQPATTIPVVGTTIPTLTLTVPTSGLYQLSFIPITNGGRMWVWATGAVANTDTTAITGGDAVTIFYG